MFGGMRKNEAHSSCSRLLQRHAFVDQTLRGSAGDDLEVRVFSIDNNPAYQGDTSVIGDFLELTAEDVIQHLGASPDVIVASSAPARVLAALSRHHSRWPDGSNWMPKTDGAKIGMELFCTRFASSKNSTRIGFGLRTREAA